MSLVLKIDPVDGDGFLNASHAASGVTIYGSGTDSPFADLVGQTVTVTLNAESYTGTIGAGGGWSVTVPSLALAALTDGSTYTINASVTDTLGHTTTASGQVTVDEHAGLIVDPVDLTGFVNGAQAAAGITIYGSSSDSVPSSLVGKLVSLSGTPYTGTVGTDGDWALNVPATALAALTDGKTYPVAMDVIDAAGNKAVATETYQLDETAGLTIKPVSNTGLINLYETTHGVTIYGTATDAVLGNIVGQTVTVKLNGQS